MTRHQLAQSFIPGLLSSGHFTRPQGEISPPAVILDVVDHQNDELEHYFPVIAEAYRLADALLEIETKNLSGL